MHAYLLKGDDHSKHTSEVNSPHLLPLPSLAEFAPYQHRTEYHLEIYYCSEAMQSCVLNLSTSLKRQSSMCNAKCIYI